MEYVSARCVHTCATVASVNIREFCFCSPLNVVSKKGDQKVWQRNWFEITILRNVSFKFVNSSFHLSPRDVFIIHINTQPRSYSNINYEFRVYREIN